MFSRCHNQGETMLKGDNTQEHFKEKLSPKGLPVGHQCPGEEGHRDFTQCSPEYISLM